MTPGEKIDDQIYVLETKVELLMEHLGLEFEFPDVWSNEPTGIRKRKRRKNESDKRPRRNSHAKE